jgi:hypothetical protein
VATFNLRQQILKEHSKAQCTRIVKWIGNNQQRFDELFKLFLHDEYRVVQRAAWPISNAVMAYPGLITPHWKALIKNVQKPGLHDAVKRNTIRLLQDIDIPKRYQGEVMEICFRYLASPTEALAVKVFSMSVLGKLAILYPAIVPELKILIEDQLPHQSAGFKSRAKKVLKQIGKL